MLFRTVEGLEQKAGVPKQKLRRLVVKELTDNGLDEGGKARVGELPNGGGYFVEDGGKGIDGTPAEIAQLFSISRPPVSTKLLHLPTRGTLGNGLRVVTGAVLASSGTLTVVTCNRRIELQPQYDGTPKVLPPTQGGLPARRANRVLFWPGPPRRFADAPLGRARLPFRAGQGLRRKVLALVVRCGAISRAAVCQWRPTGARPDRQPRRLHRRYCRYDRGQSEAQSDGLQQGQPRAGDRPARGRATSCQAGLL